jgi:hypothetical protein
MGARSSGRRVLGINCTGTCAYLALGENSTIQPEPDRLQLPAGEESESLVRLFQDAQALLREQAVDQVAILLPERGGSFQPGYFVLAPRVAIETVIRLAAVTVGSPVTMLPRATVRAVLGCGRKGSLEKYLDTVIPQPVGKYWNAGRGLAAMAALAAEKP